MAQAEEIIDDEHEEAKELEALLEGTGSEETGEEGGDKQTPEKSSRFKFSKKIWILIGGGSLLICLLVGGAYFYLSSNQNPENNPLTDESTGVGEEVSPSAPVETVKIPFSKVNIFALEPFFLPLKVGEKETGNFISVIPNLILSNSTLSKEIENSLPNIRRNIYNILSRKSPREYYSRKNRIKETVKKEILTSVNPILLAGTGTVTDVVFTQFVVK